jgi:A/G-specific adenine glycosylase
METLLWQYAAALTPQQRVAQYTQAIMDLGATVCTRSKPRCGECPFADRCAAHAAGTEQDFPAPKKPLRRQQREVWMLLVRRADGSVRLVRRPPSGIWGGLWSPPEFESRIAAEDAGQGGTGWREAQPLQHAFTHFDLLIRPLWGDLPPAAAGPGTVADEPDVLWYNAARPAQVGLPAPITQLLQDPP